MTWTHNIRVDYICNLRQLYTLYLSICAWARLCKLQKGCARLAAASDKAYQLLAHGRWFSPGTPLLPPLKLVAMI